MTSPNSYHRRALAVRTQGIGTGAGARSLPHIPMSFLTIDAETRKKVAAYLRQEAQLQRRATSLPINPAMSREQAAYTQRPMANLKCLRTSSGSSRGQKG